MVREHQKWMSGSVIPLDAQLLSSDVDSYNETASNNNLSVDGWKGDDVIKTGSGSVKFMVVKGMMYPWWIG